MKLVKDNLLKTIIILLFLFFVFSLSTNYSKKNEGELPYKQREDGLFSTDSDSSGISKEERERITVDREGIRLVKYRDIKNLQYNPVSISNYALGLYASYYNNRSDLEAKEEFIKQVDWLVENQDPKLGVWYYNFDFKDLKRPWVSAMAQGKAMSVLARAYKITDKQKYLDSSLRALKPFNVDAKDGGVVNSLDGWVWYEEYPNSKPYSFTLNGFMFSLLGLIDLYKVSGNDETMQKFLQGLDTLKQNLELWETDKISLYSLGGIPNTKYHKTHIKQLIKLYELTKDDKFLEKAVFWDIQAETKVLSSARVKKVSLLKRLKFRVNKSVDWPFDPFAIRKVVRVLNAEITR